jgi:hypothetical protein
MLRAAAAGVALACVLVAVLSGACSAGDPAPTPAPTPTPTAQPAGGLYQYFQREKELNPVRFDRLMDERGSYGLTGEISAIDGTKVQFLIKQRRFRRDMYVECKFSNEEDMVDLNLRQMVTLYGKVVKAERVLKLEECRLTRTLPKRR